MMTLSDIMFFIPARGGSKGVPNKNLIEIGGIPLVCHSIQHCLQAGAAKGQVVVSSDSDKILDVSSNFGATPLKRPLDISGDSSPTEMSMIHAMDEFPDFKYISLLQPTSPIRFMRTFKSFHFEYLENIEKHDSFMTGTKLYDFFWKRSDLNENVLWTPLYNHYNRPMRQSMPKSSLRYFDNGNMCITKKFCLKNMHSRCSGRVSIYGISELEGMQIDTLEDINIFTYLFNGGVKNLCLLENSLNQK